MNQIAIVGLGYVGLPLALQFARRGVRVLGLDIDAKKTDAILAGRSYIKHVSAEDIALQVREGKLDASTDFSRVAEADAVILCKWGTALDEVRMKPAHSNKHLLL